MLASAPIRLSKSRFLAGLQCLKRLYLQVHQPTLAERGDEGHFARLRQGDEVGRLAQSGFPGGVLVGFAQGVDDALARTAVLLDDRSVPAIFEATVQYSNILIRVDILERRPGDRWRLIEVKSSVELKAHYIYDVAIQHHVLIKCGLDVSSVRLMHLNRDYRYDGREHHPASLFSFVEITKPIRKLDAELPGLITAQRDALGGAEPPEIEAGPQCRAPCLCEFHGHCNPEPPEHHISLLPRLSEKKFVALGALGVSVIHEIPADFELSPIQARIRTAVSTGRTWVSDSLAEELDVLAYPRYFMDFESLYPAVPRFEGMWPYCQIPFQWSVHRQLTAGGEWEHWEFLAEDERDPRPGFIKTLCEALGDRGPIIVYNAGFESTRLKQLADWLPAYRGRIAKIQARLWDLLPCVQRCVYDPQFNGSFSIKAVLPALVPEMSYDGMEVGNGGQAGLAWEQMVRGGVEPSERRRLREALLAYCCQDTLAMVRILERLAGLIGLPRVSHAPHR